MSAEGAITDWPFSIYRWIELDGEILLDVTDDLSLESDPPAMDVILYSLAANYRIVRGFSQVVPDADNDEATYPVFPVLQDVLLENLVHWPPLELID